MKLEPVKSSYIRKIGYDEEKKELRVRFRNGVTWKYADVPASAHVSLLLSDSIGRFFSQEIKGSFNGRKVEEEEDDE